MRVVGGWVMVVGGGGGMGVIPFVVGAHSLTHTPSSSGSDSNMFPWANRVSPIRISNTNVLFLDNLYSPHKTPTFTVSSTRSTNNGSPYFSNTTTAAKLTTKPLPPQHPAVRTKPTALHQPPSASMFAALPDSEFQGNGKENSATNATTTTTTTTTTSDITHGTTKRRKGADKPQGNKRTTVPRKSTGRTAARKSTRRTAARATTRKEYNANDDSDDDDDNDGSNGLALDEQQNVSTEGEGQYDTQEEKGFTHDTGPLAGIWEELSENMLPKHPFDDNDDPNDNDPDTILALNASIISDIPDCDTACPGYDPDDGNWALELGEW